MSVVLPIEPDSRFRRITASAGQTQFAIAFPFQQNDDIAVLLQQDSNTWSVINSSLYQISGAGEPAGGTVTFLVGRTAGEVILVLGQAILDRLSSIVRDGRFKSQLTDDELDRNRIIQQEQQRDISRAAKSNYGATAFTFGSNIGEGRTLMKQGDFLVEGPDIVAIGADAEAAKDLAAGYASDAISQGNVPIYATIDGMPALKVPAGIKAIRVNAKSAPDDRLGGFFIDTNNGSTDTFVSGGDTARTWYRSSADRALGRRAFAGTNLYPNDVPGASSRYDANASFKTNTLGGKSLLLGAAARDGTTWVEQYMPGDDEVGRTLNYSIAAGHGYVTVQAMRGSDFINTKFDGSGNPKPDYLIVHTDVMVADHLTIAHNYWNSYQHGIITATGLFAQFYNEEKSLQNLAANAASLDPFTAAVGGNRARVAVNLHITSGINAGVPSNLLSAAIDISANGGRYRRGIVVAADALDTSSGTADAVAMAINHALTWYVADGAGAGKAVWKMFNNSGSGTLSQIILGANNLWVAAADIAVSSGRKLGLVPDATIGFRFNGANGHVELVRPDGTVIAFWVV